MVNNYLAQLSADFQNFIKQDLPPQEVAGMDFLTGKWLTLNPHINQQVKDLLLTPRGTTIMYPDYGSSVIYYMDMPITDVELDLKIETKESLERYEDRIMLINNSISLNSSTGQLNLNVEYTNTATGEVNNINV